MEFIVFVTWIVFSVLIGTFAAGRGRSGIGWALLSLLLSPLVGLIVVAVLPDLKEQVAQAQRQVQHHAQQVQQQAQQEAATKREATKITGPDFLHQVEQLRQLHDKTILTDLEFTARKAQLIVDLTTRTLVEGPEGFLGHLIPLLDSGCLTRDEVNQIKAIAFASTASGAALPTGPATPSSPRQWWVDKK